MSSCIILQMKPIGKLVNTLGKYEVIFILNSTIEIYLPSSILLM